MNIFKVTGAMLVAAVVVALPIAAQAGSAKHTAVAKVAAVRKRANHVAGLDDTTTAVVALAVVGGGLGIAAAAGAFSSKSP